MLTNLPALRSRLFGLIKVALEKQMDEPAEEQVTIWREFTFEAAHRLPNVHPNHKCARMHGHSYSIEIHVAGPIGETTGWICDFGGIDYWFANLRPELDHHTLNEVPGLENPTSENIARRIWDRMVKHAPGLLQVVVRETARGGCYYRGVSLEAEQLKKVSTTSTQDGICRGTDPTTDGCSTVGDDHGP